MSAIRRSRPTTARRQVSNGDVGMGKAETSEAPTPSEALTHPEEMTAHFDLQAGGVSLRSSARATPAGLVGVALVLLSVAAIVWVGRRTTATFR